MRGGSLASSPPALPGGRPFGTSQTISKGVWDVGRISSLMARPLRLDWLRLLVISLILTAPSFARAIGVA